MKIVGKRFDIIRKIISKSYEIGIELVLGVISTFRKDSPNCSVMDMRMLLVYSQLKIGALFSHPPYCKEGNTIWEFISPHSNWQKDPLAEQLPNWILGVWELGTNMCICPQ